jgi:hypothetical protein
MKGKLSKVSDAQLLTMIQSNSLGEIAEYFTVHQSSLSNRITKIFKNKLKGFTIEEPDKINEMNLSSGNNGAWMNSKEREYYLKYMKPQYETNIGKWRNFL